MTLLLPEQQERIQQLLFDQPVTLEGLVEVLEQYGEDAVQEALDAN